MNRVAERVLGSRPLAATLLLAPPLAWLFAASGAVSFLLALAAMAVLCFVVMSTGFLLLRAVGASEQPSAAAWVLGVFATCAAVYALVELLGITADRSFTLWALLVLTLGTIVARRDPPGPRVDRRDLLGLLLCAAVTLMWCRGIASAPEVFGREHVFPAWIDYFIHGGVISQFGDVRSVAHLSYDLSDFPLRFYHYASYMLPAAFAGPLDQPGLPLATSVWLPLGFLTMCGGAYALGVALAGQPGGIAALASLTLLPDAGTYGLRNGVFGYYWNILSSPGATYAIGITLLSVAFLRRYAALGSWRDLIAGGVLASGTLLFRANVFVLAFPAWLAAAWLSLPFFRRRRVLSAVLLICSLALARLAIYVVFNNLPGWDIAPVLETFLWVFHVDQEPTAYTGLYRRLLAYGPAVSLPAGILLVLLACLGIFALLYPAALLLARRRLSTIDCFPMLVAAFYVLLMIWAPIPPHGDTGEFAHRPFIVLYAVIVIWTATVLVQELRSQGERGPDRLWRIFFVAAMLAVAAMWSRTPAMGHVHAAWAKGLGSYVAAEGVPQAAAFLRRNAKPPDIFAVSGPSLQVVATDVATQLASLSGLSTYIARPFMQMVAPGPRRELARLRYEALVSVEREASADSALALLRELGIRWYAFVGPEGPAWDRDRSRAAFAEGKVAVYSSASR
ncbi:MAG TPA: hypothetical protein VE008_12520 [Burkholderiales bacterium]|nr:hypothetical protein [Burkholderiales bacterium]